MDRDRTRHYRPRPANLLDLLNLPAFGYALDAACTWRPARAALASAASTAPKFGWIELVARQYDEARAAELRGRGQSSSE